MKKLGILSLLIGLFISVNGQQLPLFSQYYFNSFIYNPSHAGQHNGTSLTLNARKQFTGLADGIGTYAAALQTRGVDQKAGFGFYFYNDNVNLFRTNALAGSYAYHLPLSKERTLSFGLSLSALDHRYNANNFYLINENDPLVALLGSEGGFTFDGSFGINMDFGNFQMGLANLQLLQNQEAFKGNSDNKVLYTLANHWMLNASYKIALNENFELEPYLLYRKVKNAPGQADINLFLNWLNKGYAG
ncbi:MAG: PorP/SprF family type IX secretion system membrane protein, partial [Bacteroidia bacterium]|nr:PorP/SprF family type IX secretion system membrane protein [Bacteroidia bacterium]